MAKIKLFVGILILTLVVFGCVGGAKELADSEETAGGSTTAPEVTPGEKPTESPGDTPSSDVGDVKEAAPALSPEAVEEPRKEKSRGSEGSGTASGLAEDEMLGFIEEEYAEEPGESPRISGTSGRSGRSQSSSGLKAGFADDNKQFNYFLNFLSTYGYVNHYPLDISERIIFQIKDSQGKSLPNAAVSILNTVTGQKVDSGETYADGTFYFFPSELEDKTDDFTIRISYGQQEFDKRFSRTGLRKQEIAFPAERNIKASIPLDIVFILDTTGSMGEEIERLKKTIELIHLNLTNLTIKPKVRFGLVLYKDQGDDEEYATEIVPLTPDLNLFQRELRNVYADGGGDTPENLQSALRASMERINWSRDGVKLGFIITDAPPHLDYGQTYTYVTASKKARSEGIKLFGVGTGGLDLQGEFVLRQLAQYTAGKYIFLTYGETGESEGGRAGSVSHHTGSNYQTDKLESIIIRFAKEELSYLTDEPIETEEEFFEAVKIEDEKREETLKLLFDQALTQLVDYSTYNIHTDTATAIPPLVTADTESDTLLLNAEYFTQQMLLSASSLSIFRLAEREDLQKILEEIELQLSGLFEGENVARVGELLDAEVLILGKVYRTESGFEIFLKLLRVETGEILSVTKARLQRQLGI